MATGLTLLATGMPAAVNAQSNAAADDDGAIIVTARRVEERLQDVPISISAFTQQQLQDRNISSVSDLATQTPSLQADNRFGGNNATFAIRGFRQDLRTSASVGVYFADVVAQRGGNGGIQAGDGAGPGSFFDLQNVQVLKGPQGTLFGRNTTGGAVLLVPQKPTDKLEGYVEGTYGNHNEMRLQGAVNLPVSEAIRFRVGADWRQRDGYLHSATGIGPKDFADINYFAARASLVIDLTPDLENYTIFSYTKADENGTIARAHTCAGTNTTYIVNFCQPQLNRQAGKSFFTVQNGIADARNINEQWQVINTTTWTANDNLTVKNIFAYGQLKSSVASSLQGVFYTIPASLQLFSGTTLAATIPTGALAGGVLNYNAPLPSPSGYAANQANLVDELQIQGQAADGALIWQAGLYFEKSTPRAPSGSSNQNQIICTGAAPGGCIDPLATFLRRPIGNYSSNEVETKFRNIGVYAQGTYALARNVNLTAGIRYTWDRTSGVGQMLNSRLPATAGDTVPAFYPCSIAGPTAASMQELVTNGCNVSGVAKSSAPTWVVSLDYSPAQDVMLYAKYSRGYRQGAYSSAAPLGFQSFDPEKIDAYEIGLKSQFGDDNIRMLYNVSAFYNKLSDQQVLTAFADTTGALSSTVVAVNVGKSRLYGIELDASLDLFDVLKIDASYAFLDSRIEAIDSSKFPTSYGPQGTAFPFYNVIRSVGTVVGGRFGLLPSNKLTITGTVRIPIDESAGKLTIGATYSYSDEYDYTSGRFGTVPPVSLVNANLNWKSVAGSPVDLSVFATNLLNKKYYTSVNDNTSAIGQVSGLVGEPRMYGLRLKYTFGD